MFGEQQKGRAAGVAAGGEHAGGAADREARGRDQRWAREDFGLYSVRDRKPLGGGEQRSDVI